MVYGPLGGRFDGIDTPSVKKRKFVWNQNVIDLPVRSQSNYGSLCMISNDNYMVSVICAPGNSYSTYRFDLNTGEGTLIQAGQKLEGIGVYYPPLATAPEQYYMGTIDTWSKYNMFSAGLTTLSRRQSYSYVASSIGDNPQLYQFYPEGGGRILNCSMYDAPNNVWISKGSITFDYETEYDKYAGYPKCCAVEGGFLIFGSNSSSYEINVYKYDLATDSFSFVTHFRTPDSWLNSYKFTTFLHGDRITAINGLSVTQYSISEKRLLWWSESRVNQCCRNKNRVFTMGNSNGDGKSEITFFE